MKHANDRRDRTPHPYPMPALARAVARRAAALLPPADAARVLARISAIDACCDAEGWPDDVRAALLMQQVDCTAVWQHAAALRAGWTPSRVRALPAEGLLRLLQAVGAGDEATPIPAKCSVPFDAGSAPSASVRLGSGSGLAAGIAIDYCPPA